MSVINRFDFVRILTTKRIKFVSGPDGRPSSPHGNWSVVGFSRDSAVLAKDETIIIIPVQDLEIVAKYKLEDDGNVKK